MPFAQWLQSKIDQHGFSNYRIAKMAGVHQSTVFGFYGRSDKMTVNQLIEEIGKIKETLNLTNKMISDASGVPKSTVDRILRGETNDPSAQTILDIAYVVGYRLVNDNDNAPMGIDGQLVNMLERENRLKTVQSNSLIAAKDRTIEDKSRWVKFLTASTITFAILTIATWAGIALLLHYDITHLSTGFFRG